MTNIVVNSVRDLPYACNTYALSCWRPLKEVVRWWSLVLLALILASLELNRTKILEFSENSKISRFIFKISPLFGEVVLVIRGSGLGGGAE